MSNNGKEATIDRLIFRYWDGTKYRCADPLKVQIAIETAGFDLADMANLESTLDPENQTIESLVMLDKVATMVRQAFGLEDVGCDEEGNPTGHPILECLGILMQYVEFSFDLKKTEGSNPTLQRLTELGQSLESKAADMPDVHEQASATKPSASSSTTSPGSPSAGEWSSSVELGASSSPTENKSVPSSTRTPTSRQSSVASKQK